MTNRLFYYRKVLIRWIVFTIACIALQTASAQNPVLLECINISKAYLKTPYLSFNVNYKYSLEAAPTTILDSSSGIFKTNGYHYWGKVDSVEFMQNDSFLVTVFKPEKILSLGLPNYNFNTSLPLARWDSLFYEHSRFSFTMGVDSIWKKITVDYDPGLPYKKFEMWYDSISHLIHRIKYSVSEFATDKNFYSLGSPGNYEIVDGLFSNYQTGMFTDDVFLTSAYISYSGHLFIPNDETYQLYISSAGLLKY